jgi:hypothetical protein
MEFRKALRLLEVPDGASLDAERLRSAHRMLVKVWHPDRFAGDAEMVATATKRLAEINAAYAFLKAHLAANGGVRMPPPPPAPPSREAGPPRPAPPPSPRPERRRSPEPEARRAPEPKPEPAPPSRPEPASPKPSPRPRTLADRSKGAVWKLWERAVMFLSVTFLFGLWAAFSPVLDVDAKHTGSAVMLLSLAGIIAVVGLPILVWLAGLLMLEAVRALLRRIRATRPDHSPSSCQEPTPPARSFDAKAERFQVRAYVATMGALALHAIGQSPPASEKLSPRSAPRSGGPALGLRGRS